MGRLQTLWLAVLIAGCFSSTPQGGSDGGDGSGDRSGDGDGVRSGDGDGDRSGDGGRQSTHPACSDGSCVEISVTQVDKIDVLFVVDNSQSMAQEQVSLREQFPRLLTALATGELQLPDGNMRTFQPFADINLGVVSTDMGMVGISGVTSCSGFGDDGVLQNAPSPDPELDCSASYPRFLNYTDDGTGQREQRITQVAGDFQCMATLGIDGCGFEQQLEAGLKALWPSVDIDPTTGEQWVEPDTNEPGNRLTFLADAQGNGRYGHGDRQNAGFLRNDPSFGLSQLLIVMVTDEEDCSSYTTQHFTPGQFLMDGDPLKQQPINLRCFHNKDHLYSIDRYVNGFQALRPGNENLVSFAAIVGVPPDLAQLYDDNGDPYVDLQDDEMRAQWYDEMLADVRMTERVDDSIAEVQKRNLVPSCNGGGDSTAVAYPPRRIVETAREFGAQGLVQSICQDDFSSPFTAIIEMLSRSAQPLCYYMPLSRDDDGRVACDLYWELPGPGAPAPADVPRNCDESAFLSAPDPSRPQTGERGGQLCLVRQLDVPPSALDARTDAERNQALATVEAQGDGWFYDDFSDQARACREQGVGRFSFTAAAKPPTGVVAIANCEE